VITKAYIVSTLNELERLYNNSSSQKKSVYYSKLAVIELCGWIEGSMDDIIETNKRYVKNDIITPTHGFHYKSHFRPMLMKSVGIVALEKLEHKLENGGAKITILKSTLGRLRGHRNDAAHTFIKGVTNTFDAPSMIKNDFNSIYPILKEIETEIRKI